MQTWGAEYITEKAAGSSITVDLSPHGRSDAVVCIDLTQGGIASDPHQADGTKKCFVTPWYVSMCAMT